MTVDERSGRFACFYADQHQRKVGPILDYWLTIGLPSSRSKSSYSIRAGANEAALQEGVTKHIPRVKLDVSTPVPFDPNLPVAIVSARSLE